mgnify:CR=1 FL=1
MPSPGQDEIELARLLGSLWTEVFQRTVKEENKPISKSSHKQDRMTLKEDFHTVLTTNTNKTLWGVAGASHHLAVDNIQGVWSEGGSWG